MIARQRRACCVGDDSLVAHGSWELCVGGGEVLCFDVMVIQKSRLSFDLFLRSEFDSDRRGHIPNTPLRTDILLKTISRRYQYVDISSIDTRHLRQNYRLV